jgi:hypothetical protein
MTGIEQFGSSSNVFAFIQKVSGSDLDRNTDYSE